MSLTPAQQQAVHARGDTLVMAGAGTGKTHTLVETCVQRLLNELDDIGIDEVLMVTFTEAAAAEIRQRIRTRLEREFASHPESARLQAQLAGLDTAAISTLHSFCLQLVREHFHELHLDPALSVLAEEQSALLASESLDELFEHHYRGETEESAEVRRFLRDHARGWEERARELILTIHHFTQTRPDPAGWFAEQIRQYLQPEPRRWRSWLIQAFLSWRDLWRPVLDEQDPDNTVARACREILNSPHAAEPQTDPARGAAAVARVTGEILALDIPDRWPRGTKMRFRKPIEKIFADAAFLNSLTPSDSAADPLAEDWQWVRGPMATLLRLAREFGERFARNKRERGGLDFHDLEQMSLQLLWDASAQQPTPLARQWRDKLKLVFVDEYQDINEAQDTILRALSREGADSNRFLVGDIKQSIYRFRQAAPGIFQTYARRWAEPSAEGQAIYLQENFRSGESILQFVNAFFGARMREEVGGVAYDGHAQLLFGAPDARQPLAGSSAENPRVELLLHLKSSPNGADHPDQSEGDGSPATIPDASDLSETETEARRIGQRLQELRQARHPVWDAPTQTMRPVEWRDMVILLRSPKAKVESYAKMFARLGIPLEAKRTGFFDSLEVQDLLNLLTLLDNPLQDLPAVAVLRSPLGGFSVDDLARVRAAAPKLRYWTALRAWHREAEKRLRPAETGTSAREGDVDGIEEAGLALWQKVDVFLNRYDRWRTQARHASLSQRLEMVLTETNYLDWLLTQDRGEQRQANVRQLLHLAREFDELHAQGLHRFLKMIAAQQEIAGDREPAPLESGQAVRLMSIHQSKGLEFPVVVVADLGKPFNLSEQRLGLILDESLGLCPQVRPPDSGSYYPSLPLWMAKHRQRAEALGEELRVLYVAMTRAQDLLILSGTASASAALEKWPQQAEATASAPALLQATNYLAWLGPWLTASAGQADWPNQPAGRTPLWHWRVFTADAEHNGTTEISPPPATAPLSTPAPFTEQNWERVQTALDWQYRFAPATRAPAKTSVTALRRQWSTADEEAAAMPFARGGESGGGRRSHAAGLAAQDVGLAHHKLLEHARLDHMRDLSQLEAEADRLWRGGQLTEAERQSLHLEDVAAFWSGKIGTLILEAASHVIRELPFTCRLAGNGLTAQSGFPWRELPPDDFCVVQGVADLVVLSEREIWILDFKTDHFPDAQLDAKVSAYAPQLQLYGFALEKIYGKPVTRQWLHFLSKRHTAAIP